MTTAEDCSSYLGYIEPTAEQQHVILCAIPFIRDALSMEYPDLIKKFYVSFNGYLFYLWEGRLIRLWMDLGFQTEVAFDSFHRSTLGHDYLSQKSVTRALTAYSAFPNLGTFVVQGMMFQGSDMVQGDKARGMDRFVTYKDCDCDGGIVGDLVSGKTYVMRDSKTKKKLAIPYEKEGGVGFYSVPAGLMKDFSESMEASGDMKERFEELCVAYREKEEPKIDFAFFPYEGRCSLVPKEPTKRMEGYDTDGDSSEDETDGYPKETFGSSDWDMPVDALRNDEDYNVEFSHVEPVEELDFFKIGFDDAFERRIPERLNKWKYTRGYQAGYRSLEGYCDDSDEDPFSATHRYKKLLQLPATEGPDFEVSDDDWEDEGSEDEDHFLEDLQGGDLDGGEDFETNAALLRDRMLPLLERFRR
ncbi:hypothetical protein CJU89_1163 [Yarrowia sp. B02]|nr:hypothetical protein CJU89_1163 [Yarrowia sp. B02]